MKSLRNITLAAILLAVAVHMPATAKNIVTPKAYLFGFSASFNDSTVYFTDIQEVDSVWFTQKKKMLLGRSNYSYQLRDYLNQKLQQPKRTCIVIGSIDRKKVEKKYEKMKKLYTTKSGNRYDVLYIQSSDFRFQPVNMGDDQPGEAPPSKKR